MKSDLACTSDAKALAEIQRLARLGRVAYTYHSRLRLRERNVGEDDVVKALLTAVSAVHQADRRNWKVVGGVDLDGEDLIVIVDVAADVLVVTLF